MAAISHAFARKLDATRWGAAIYAAFIAGIVYLILQTLTTALIQGYSAWLPLRMIAAIALGTSVLPELGFSLEVVLTAFLIHFGLSIMTAWILAPLIEGVSLLKAVLIGAALGLVIYLVNYHVLTAAFTWFGGLRGWSTLINHLIFGAVMAWSYQRRRLRPDFIQPSAPSSP